MAFIRHRSEIGVCFVRKPDGNVKEVSEIPEYIRMYIVEGLVEQRKLRINHALREYARIKTGKSLRSYDAYQTGVNSRRIHECLPAS